MASKFLTAEWKYLIMANYVIDPEVLLPYLPAKTLVDTWNGKCYVSLVGFLFHNTKVLGIKIPFHKNFEEINLRFYVTHNDNGNLKRGVVFIKEIVPKLAISFIANNFFNEQYITCGTINNLVHNTESLSVEYRWKYKKEWNSLAVKAEPCTIAIAAGSEEEFITEHYWGYSKAGNNNTTEYQVEHPRWKVHRVSSYEINCKFDKLYGESFAFLDKATPVSVLLAEGSEIAVRNKRRL